MSWSKEDEEKFEEDLKKLKSKIPLRQDKKKKKKKRNKDFNRSKKLR